MRQGIGEYRTSHTLLLFQADNEKAGPGAMTGAPWFGLAWLGCVPDRARQFLFASRRYFGANLSSSFVCLRSYFGASFSWLALSYGARVSIPFFLCSFVSSCLLLAPIYRYFCHYFCVILFLHARTLKHLSHVLLSVRARF